MYWFFGFAYLLAQTLPRIKMSSKLKKYTQYLFLNKLNLVRYQAHFYLCKPFSGNNKSRRRSGSGVGRPPSRLRPTKTQTGRHRWPLQVLQHGPYAYAVDGWCCTFHEHGWDTERCQRCRASHEQPPEPQGRNWRARGQLHRLHLARKGAFGQESLRQRRD